MRTFPSCVLGGVITFFAAPAAANVIMVSPADGSTGYTKIEGAMPGDEVIIAPGTYAYRVYLTQTASAAQPITIHAEDPANPPVWDMGTTLVDDAPGDYTAGDKARGCWQVSGGTNITIEGIVFKDCHAADYDSAGLRYYGGTTGLVIDNCLFEDNDNGLTGGTEASEATVEFSEFAGNGNTNADPASPTHNIYIYGGTFTMMYSYLHDPTQGQNLHCRAVNSTIEYNWFDRAKSYVGDLMTSDDYANNPTGTDTQTMLLLGNVVIETAAQANDSQIFAMDNDEAVGSTVNFHLTALYNTVVGAGGHANFVHVANDATSTMTVAASNNIISGTSEPFLIDDMTTGSVTGKNNWIQTGATSTGAALTGSVTGSSPGFHNAAAYDYTLASGSACIGAAAAGVTPLPTDEYYENETVTREYRARATAMDLGAFEHDTTGPGIGPAGPMDGGTVVVQAPDSGTSDANAGGTSSGATSGTSSGGGTTSSSGGGTTGGGSSGESPSGGEADGATTSTGGKSGCGCVTAGASEGAGAWWSVGVGVAAIAAVRGRKKKR
jgi:hypothetical protein